MKSVQVVYATMTGHSRKIAQAIASQFQVSAHNVKEQPNLGPTDLLFIVGGIYGGDSKVELLDFVKNLEGVGKVALITSSASPLSRQDKVRAILEEKKIPIVQEFNVPGSFLIFKFGRPYRRDIQACVDVAVQIFEMNKVD